jgi:hypothetical protein
LAGFIKDGRCRGLEQAVNLGINFIYNRTQIFRVDREVKIIDIYNQQFTHVVAGDPGFIPVI